MTLYSDNNLKRVRYYICPVEGSVDESDPHTHVYDVVVYGNNLAIYTTNKGYLCVGTEEYNLCLSKEQIRDRITTPHDFGMWYDETGWSNDDLETAWRELDSGFIETVATLFPTEPDKVTLPE